ncbi:hypothetical protein ScPMuIL_006966 [Solemya velum]
MVGVGLLVASLATDHWVKADVVDNHNQTLGGTTVSPIKRGGFMTFGLFRGFKSINYGAGRRDSSLYVKDYIYDFGMFSAGLWVSTIVMTSLAIAMGLVAMGFSMFNIFGKPIETLTGVPGLYLWNCLAGLFSVLAVAVYLALYFQEFKDNVLLEYDLGNNLTSVDRAYLDWSFYLVVASMLAFLINPILLKCSGSSVSCSFQQEAEKVTEEYPIY